MFRCVGTLAGIMGFEAGLEVFGEAGIEAFGFFL